MEYNLKQSSYQRARQDTEKFRQSRGCFWSVEVIGAALIATGGGFLGYWLTPDNASDFEKYAYPTVGSAVGFIVGVLIIFALIFLTYLLRAPYRQRDDARAAKRIVQEESNKKIGQLEIELRDIRNAMPDISTELITGECTLLIEVRNNGGIGADFTAMGKAIDNKARIEPYVMYWEGNSRRECPINGKGDCQYIKVAETSSSNLLFPNQPEYSIYKNELAGFMWDGSQYAMFPIRTYERYESQDANGSIRHGYAPKNKGIIEVTITSEPPLLNRFETHRYSIGIDDVGKLIFTEIPISDKEGSQRQ